MKIQIGKSKTVLTLIAFVAVAALATTSKADVWKNENQWSADWEMKYKEWLQTTPTARFFSAEKKANGSANPYYGIRVDCADMVYSLRIIFSYENKLPFAMHNPARKSGALITNSITRFDRAEDGIVRLKSFLTWIYDIVSTHTIPDDTYSTGFKDVGPGSIIVTSKKNHHSWTILKISKVGNPTLIFNSTVGRESGFDVQVRQSWPNPFWIFEPEVDATDETKSNNIYAPGSYAGFRYWRPIESMSAPESAVPKYSEEQHLVGISKWKQAAQKVLATTTETIDQVVIRLLKDACSDLNQRVAAVAEAEVYKSKLASAVTSGDATNQYVQEVDQDKDKPSDLRCMIYKYFDQFSTPSRDRRLADALVLARAYYQLGINKQGEKAFLAENLKIYKTIFPFIMKSAAEEADLDTNAKSANNFCAVKLNSQLGLISLAEVKRQTFKGRISSNPNDAMSGRFGFAKTENDLGSICPSYDLKPNAANLIQTEEEALREVSASSQAL